MVETDYSAEVHSRVFMNPFAAGTFLHLAEMGALCLPGVLHFNKNPYQHHPKIWKTVLEEAFSLHLRSAYPQQAPSSISQRWGKAGMGATNPADNWAARG